MTGADNTDDLALLVNAPSLAESLLDSLEQAAKDIGLFMKVKLMSSVLNKNEPF